VCRRVTTPPNAAMVMDQVFGQLASLHSLESDLAYIDDSKEMMMNEISMDLDDFKFDFDCLSDSLGPWIQSDCDDSSSSSSSSSSGDSLGLCVQPSQLELSLSDVDDEAELKSEPADFEDLNITEAVRYDCMWSSQAHSIATASAPALGPLPPRKSLPLCENTLFEEFLKIIDIPTQFDLDEDIRQQQQLADELKPARGPRRTDADVTDDSDRSEQENQARLLTSLDHSYVSTAGLPGRGASSPSPRRVGYSDSSGFPATPPESSEDEEPLPSSSPFPHVINPGPTATSHNTSTPSSSSSASACSRSQSLLKRVRLPSGGGGGEAKFSFRCKFKPEKSRSLLKQKLRLSTSSSSSSRSNSSCSNNSSSSSSGFYSSSGSSSFTNSCELKNSPTTTTSIRQQQRQQQQPDGHHHQRRPAAASFSATLVASSSSSSSSSKHQLHASIRRRKEESLKVKHHEARQIHNHMERQRRNELKAAFDELKGCIPEIAGSDKVSKQMILDTALHNCKLIKSRQLGVRLRRDKLKKCNAQLKEKLKRLQALAATSRRVDG